MEAAERACESWVNESAFGYYARLTRLKLHLECNISEPLSAGEAAGIVGLERKYFSTFFRDKVGVPFHVWRDSVRIAEATRLLRTCNAPITRVAESAGFRDLRTFERVFKRHLGRTPRAFKQNVRPS